MFQRVEIPGRPYAEWLLKYTTMLYSTIKKSGKTLIGAGVGRWAAEELDRYGEVYCVANDQSQASERTYAAVRKSIELTPGWDQKHRDLPGVARVTDVSMSFHKSKSILKPVSLDAHGEAGANPVCSVWSEVWGFDNAPALLLWDELTSALTRKNSFRFVESYAGIDPDSELLLMLYNSTVKDGRQITAQELADVTGEPLGVFEEATEPGDLVPLFVNERAGLIAYWDEGEIARRMPWQRGERAEKYYQSEAEILTDNSYQRVHYNHWTGSTSDFVDDAWWQGCHDTKRQHIPGFVEKQTRAEIILSADASVSGDCTALVAVSRHPKIENQVIVRWAKKWDPPKGGTMDYATTLEAAIRWFCANFNVINLVYDSYQLHDMMTRLRKEQLCRVKSFSQGKRRMEADKRLYDMIKAQTIHWSRLFGGDDLTEHIHNSASKQGKEEDTKLRLIKKDEKRKIDLAVALSMAADECMRLTLDPTGESIAA